MYNDRQRIRGPTTIPHHLQPLPTHRELARAFVDADTFLVVTRDHMVDWMDIWNGELEDSNYCYPLQN